MFLFHCQREEGLSLISYLLCVKWLLNLWSSDAPNSRRSSSGSALWGNGLWLLIMSGVLDWRIGEWLHTDFSSWIFLYYLLQRDQGISYLNRRAVRLTGAVEGLGSLQLSLATVNFRLSRTWLDTYVTSTKREENTKIHDDTQSITC